MMPSDPVTLADLRIWSKPARVSKSASFKTDRPATLDDLIQVLEGMGAKRVTTVSGVLYPRPGSYLVLPLPAPQEEK